MTPASCISIRRFRPGDARAFRELNTSWIHLYFDIEPEDEALFDDPEGRILLPGGEIFLVVDNDTPVGCCGLMPAGPGVLELIKMTIAESHRGRGLGRRLLEHAIGEARSRGAAALVLGSNAKLTAAIRLYESAGFRHMRPEEIPHLPYDRVNVFMRKEL